MKTLTKYPGRQVDVPCPFCSLICDDLVIKNEQGVISAEKNACLKATKEFNRTTLVSPPKINGRRAALDEAIQFAADLLKKSQQPLFSGLATDVNGMRSILHTADKTGGIVEHMDGETAARNLRVLQDRGWINTTLMEVKNRADFIMLAGTDTSVLPNFIKRMVMNKDSLFNKNLAKREVIYLGDDPATLKLKLKMPNRRKIKLIKFKPDRMVEVLGAVKAILAGKDLQAKKIANVNIKELEKLAQKMRRASYGVIVWAPSDMNWPHADITIHSICNLIEEINLTTRFAGLPLAGNEGGMTAAGVCAWQSGYPMKISYSSGYPRYNPSYSVKDLLTSDKVDTLVWIASISSNLPPPQTRLPTIVLATPAMKFRTTPSVYIPVGTPGVDHSGQMIRCDNVASQRLLQLRKTGLPSVAAVMDSVRQAI